MQQHAGFSIRVSAFQISLMFCWLLWISVGIAWPLEFRGGQACLLAWGEVPHGEKSPNLTNCPSHLSPPLSWLEPATVCEPDEENCGASTQALISQPAKHSVGIELSLSQGSSAEKSGRQAESLSFRRLAGCDHTPEGTDRLGAHVCVRVREPRRTNPDYKFQSAQRRSARGL